MNLVKKIQFIIFVLILISLMFLVYTLSYMPAFTYQKTVQRYNSTNPNLGNRIVLVTVSCQNRFNETLTMIYSSLLNLKAMSQLQLILFTESNLMDLFQYELNKIASKKSNFQYLLEKIELPQQNQKEWHNLFKPCASQRLFLPNLLMEFDAILYVDSDILFVSSIDNIWYYFTAMNSSQMLAMVLDNENPSKSWYKRYAKHPALGVNSGVILMNLTKMRKFHWNYYMIDIFHHFKRVIKWGDQDIINILLHYYPNIVLLLPCAFNFRPECCDKIQWKLSNHQDITIIHGSRNSFHKNTIFGRIFNEFEQLKINDFNISLNINNLLSNVCD